MVVPYDLFCVGTFIYGVDEALHDDALDGVIIGWRGWRDDTLTFTLGSDWDSPEVVALVTPTYEHYPTIEFYCYPMFQEEYATACITQCAYC